jgi:hypothetical protein
MVKIDPTLLQVDVVIVIARILLKIASMKKNEISMTLE